MRLINSATYQSANKTKYDEIEAVIRQLAEPNFAINIRLDYTKNEVKSQTIGLIEVRVKT